MSDWLIYNGMGEPHDDIGRLPPPPPWRTFDGGPAVALPPASGTAQKPADLHRAITYRPETETVELVNAALYLRRPLLVTGLPGAGKSTLAHAVAHELQLGPVLHWPITSRITLRDGLYQYDPLARLYSASQQAETATGMHGHSEEDIGRYLRLGPLGTALLPYERPRALLIDEIDKSDLDLPNDLLTLFEEGQYEIPELVRIAHIEPVARVMVADRIDQVEIRNGQVRCREFPLVIMTSNGEREFPPAFLRRCINLQLRAPDPDRLAAIVESHLGRLADRSGDIVQQFLERRDEGELATDQLLNAIFLTYHAARVGQIDRLGLAERVMPYLSIPSEQS